MDFCTWALPISQAWAPLVYGGCTSLGHPWELRDVRLCIVLVTSKGPLGAKLYTIDIIPYCK